MGIPYQQPGGVSRRCERLDGRTPAIVAEEDGQDRLTRPDPDRRRDQLTRNAQRHRGIVGLERLPLTGHWDGFGRAPERQQEPEEFPEPFVEEVAMLDLPRFLGVHQTLMDQAILRSLDRLGDPPQDLEGFPQSMPGPGATI